MRVERRGFLISRLKERGRGSGSLMKVERRLGRGLGMRCFDLTCMAMVQGMRWLYIRGCHWWEGGRRRRIFGRGCFMGRGVVGRFLLINKELKHVARFEVMASKLYSNPKADTYFILQIK
jgi:hypothetical protein